MVKIYTDHTEQGRLYYKAINMLKELIKLSPYPVKFVPPFRVGGCFKHPVFNQWIEINENLSIAKKINILAHELGHAMCYKNSCICFDKGKKILREFHAFKYSLSLLYIIEDKNILALCIKDIVKSYYKSLGEWHKYHLAAKHIMNTPLWKRCIKLVYSNKQLLLFN